jgi:hypothetical protein
MGLHPNSAPNLMQGICPRYLYGFFVTAYTDAGNHQGYLKSHIIPKEEKIKTGLVIVLKAKVCDTYLWNAANIWRSN